MFGHIFFYFSHVLFLSLHTWFEMSINLLFLFVLIELIIFNFLGFQSSFVRSSVVIPSIYCKCFTFCHPDLVTLYFSIFKFQLLSFCH